jgi:hypothetical protein
MAVQINGNLVARLCEPVLDTPATDSNFPALDLPPL